MATGYEYTPLHRERQEIRLLCFDAELSSFECFDAPLNCTIKHITTLSEPLPEFYAISWTWGDSKNRGALRVDGKSVTVPENAETALRHLLASQIEQRNTLRPSILKESTLFAESPIAGDSPGTLEWPSTEIRFWLDCICINQRDPEEKSWQLLLIAEIYTQCQEVCIWLGEDDDGMAEDMAGSIAGVVERCRDETNDLEDLFETLWAVTPNELSPRASQTPLPILSNMSVLRSIYSGPWFRRLWVLQEAILAGRANCYRGLYSVPFREVALAARWLWFRTCGRLFPGDHQYAAHTIGIQNAATMWDMLSTPLIVPRVLSNLLLLGLRFDVTDPRDKVYAILGLLNDEDFASLKEELLPDYSISLAELYTRVARAIIDETQSLFITRIGSTLVPHDEKLEDGLDVPSWVPRFDRTHDVNFGSPSSIRPLQEPVTGAFGLRLRLWDGLPGVLTVQGLVVDEIGHLSGAPWMVTSSKALKSQMISSWSLTVEHGRKGLCGSLASAFAETICAGRNKLTQDAARDPAFPANCAAFFSSCGPMCDSLTEYFMQPKTNDCARFAGDKAEIPKAMAQNSRNLLYFITADGRLAMGPKTACQGDKVCIIPGCDVPVVLRRDGAFWRYLGDAYVHGLMDGDYFRQKAKSRRLEAEMRWLNIH